MSTTTTESKFQQIHPDGLYTVKVIGQTLGESEKKSTPYIGLKVEVLKLIKAKDGRQQAIKIGAHRFINLWLTEKTIEKAKAFLSQAGFPKGKSLATLHPEHPQFFDLSGYEFTAANKPEEYTDKDGNRKPIDRFDFLPSKDPNGWMEKIKTVNNSRILHMDAIFASAPGTLASAPKPAPKADPKPEQKLVAFDDVPFDIPEGGSNEPGSNDPADGDFNW